ncbi:Hypothetical protein I5071_61050 [Sandaracinus amylolyticus]|nr:Hypothetical protein I5071_61050 [Sandaracinus amylolyticus]
MGWVEHSEAAFVVGSRERIVAAIWRGEPTYERLQRSFEVTARAMERAGPGVGFVVIVEPGSPPPDAASLPWVAGVLDRLVPLAAIAVVLEERTDVLVDAAAEIHSMTRPRRQPLKVLADADEAVVWLLRRLEPENPSSGRADVRAWIETLRAALPEPS